MGLFVSRRYFQQLGITLRPAVVFSGEKLPSREEISALHHAAHEECFIANSVRSEVVCEPVFLPA